MWVDISELQLYWCYLRVISLSFIQIHQMQIICPAPSRLFLRFREVFPFLKPQSLSLSSFACPFSLDPAHIPSCHCCWQVTRIGKQGQILPKPSGLNYSTTDAPAGIHNTDQDNRLLCWLVRVYHQRTSLKQRSESWPWETATFI